MGNIRDVMLNEKGHLHTHICQHCELNDMMLWVCFKIPQQKKKKKKSQWRKTDETQLKPGVGHVELHRSFLSSF